MRYSLATLAKGKGRRVSFALRSIVLTAALEGELTAIFRAIPAEWARLVQVSILPAYAADQLTRDDAGSIERVLQMAALSGVGVRLSLNQRIARWLGLIDSWHRNKWSAAVMAATGLDVFPFVDLAQNREAIQAIQSRIASLVRGLDDDLRKSVEEAVWRGYLERTPRRQIGRELAEKLAISRRRANFIASDQANKTAAELDRIRQQDAGIEQFKWRTAEDSRVRPEHVALNGKIFRWDKPPSVGLPGSPPRCRCKGQAWVEI